MSRSVPITGGLVTIGSVIVSNLYGSVASAAAQLTVLRSAPQFTLAPHINANTVGLRLGSLSGHGNIIIYTSADFLTWM